MCPARPALQPEAMDTTTVNPQASNHTGPQALSRPGEGRMVAGVAAGAARYLGVDATVIRIVFVVLALAGGAGLPLYLAGWLLIPDEETGQSVASQFIQQGQAR